MSFSSSDVNRNNKVCIQIIKRVEYQFNHYNRIMIPVLDPGRLSNKPEREMQNEGAKIYASKTICLILKEQGHDDVGCIRLVHYKNE